MKSLKPGSQGSSDPALVVENLFFKYRDRPDYALRDITFELEAGQIMLVAGTSGCGKTTLIRCINGLIPRSYKGELEGRVVLHGEETDDKPLAAISQIVGTVLQDPERQILGSRVVNEVAFGLENLGLPPAEITARVDETLDYLGINHLRRRETFYLSGGEKQKVALAGILAMQPSILLLDEPLASLDPASAQEALRLIRQLADEGRAILIVEHRVEDILKIRPEKALFLMDGQVHYLGPTAGLERVVDYREVKLPAPMIIEKARRLCLGAEVLGCTGEISSAPLLPCSLAPLHKLVEFQEVSFAYEDGPLVLHDVNVTINRGDIIAILGPNGAGKTTLVKHAIGLLKPKEGRVLVEGVDTHELSVAEIARTLGYVFQSPSHMLFAPTVREELAFGPKNLGYDQATIDQGVAEAVSILNLSGLEEYSPLALSFGQQKRVSIAAIMSMRSKILVMDEPTAGQDYKNYMAFMDSILQLPNFEAILFITHDIDLAVCYANRVILVYEGCIVADGPPQEVLARYDLLERCHIVPTSLLAANLERLPQTGRFMRAELLAHAA
ncbi:MAG: ABC transporter ATP-binding protein [Chloroflexi bacterium]|nr:ABC transporter ATP-binding protein [Chloroflexota bacterium]